MNLVGPHPDPKVELIAKTLWDSERHHLLAAAGHTVVWEEQPKAIKRHLWRKAIKVLTALDEHNQTLTQGE